MQRYTRARMRKRRQRRLIAIIGTSTVVLLVVLIVYIASMNWDKQDNSTANENNLSMPTDLADALAQNQGPENWTPPTDGVQADETLPPEDIATTSQPNEAWRAGVFAPEPEREGYLPVYTKANTSEKKICITVDDCFQTENLREIVQVAIDTGGKLTIFPIGNLLKREGLQEVIRYAHAAGFEIENHTYSHSGLYHETHDKLAKQIFDQDRAVDYVLGVDYTIHFLRPRGGDDKDDIRTHQYISQLGYYGIAHWSVSGSGSSIDKLKSGLKPGDIYLFHTTDKDLATLKAFIPYAREMGYELVTMNELFGYADNEVKPQEVDPKQLQVPPLEKYEPDYKKSLKKNMYSYAVYEVQFKLREKGFIESEPDGVYGGGTEKAVKKWQSSIGAEASGVITGDQQRMLLES